MSCCIENINIGCVDNCGLFQLPYYAPVTGTYILEIHFAGATRRYTFTASAGEKFAIDGSLFNESGTSVFKIIKPNGDYLSVTNGEDEFECFEVKVNLIYNEGTMENTSCCTPVILKIEDAQQRIIQKSEWLQFGALPTIEVFYTDEEGNSIPMVIQPIYDSLPDPETITVNISGALAEWYIKITA